MSDTSHNEPATAPLPPKDPPPTPAPTHTPLPSNDPPPPTATPANTPLPPNDPPATGTNTLLPSNDPPPPTPIQTNTPLGDPPPPTPTPTRTPRPPSPPDVEVHASFYLTCLEMALTMTFMWLHLAAFPVFLIFLDKTGWADYFSMIPFLVALPGFIEGITSVPTCRRFLSYRTYKVYMVMFELVFTASFASLTVVRVLVRVLSWVDFSQAFGHPWVVMAQVFIWLYLCPIWRPKKILYYVIVYWFILAGITATLVLHGLFISPALYFVTLSLWASNILLQRIAQQE